MNFQLAGAGRSFKGAFAYYLHDKRQDPSGPYLETAARVAWMEVRNLAHDDPAYVQGVMIATARNADAIKKEAGIKATGRKATAGAVFSYSIQWHPENETIPDRAGMIEVAEQTLRLLGAAGHQAAIIAHTDTKHPHIHVVVNRVDPSTGKMLVLDKNALRLDEWAAKYERDRGQIVSPNRDAKHEARKRRAEQQAEGKSPQQVFSAATKPEPAPPAPFPPQLAPAKQPDPPKPAPAAAPASRPADPSPAQPPKPKTRAGLLAERQAAQKIRHKQEWADLAATNKARRAAVYGERIDFKAIAAEHRAQTRPQWSELGKALAAEQKAFRQREKSFPGLVTNALALASIQIGQGQTQGRGILSQTFRLMLDSQARHAGFAAWEQQEKAKLAQAQNVALQGRFAAAKMAQAEKLAEVRAIYNRDRAALITRQDLEKARVRDEWRQIYAERDRLAQAAYRSRERMTRTNGQNYRHGRRLDRATRPPIDSQAKAPGQTIPTPQQQEPQPVKPDFSRASQLPVAKLPAEPVQRMSVSVPDHRPVPEGVAVPPARRMDPVQEPDRAKAYAATPEGAKATAQQKAAPDALRRAYRPPAPQSPAAGSAAPQRLSAADFRRNAAPPMTPAAQQEQPRMSAADFRKNALEISGTKPEPDRQADQDRDRRPRPRR